MMGLFDPAAAKKKKEEAGSKRKASAKIKEWVLEFMPEEIKKQVETVSVREVQCGDPKCSPIDTAIQVMLSTAGARPLLGGIPCEMTDVTRAKCKETVAEMVAELGEAEFDPISPQAVTVFQGIQSELFSRMDELSFTDRMGVCQRLFASIEEYEQRVMQYQAAMMRRSQMQQNPHHNMLLSYAQQNKPDEIQRIVDEGVVDVSTGHSVGQTALHVACLWGNTAATECLIGNRAQVNRPNNLTGGTPLHIAVTSPKAIEGRLECAKLLLDAGANPSIRDARGNTAVDYAIEHEADEPQMLALIQPYAAAAAAAAADAALGTSDAGLGGAADDDDDDYDDARALQNAEAEALD